MFEVISVDKAREKILQYLNKKKIEKVYFSEALGRVTAENIYSPMNLPPFSRSTVDGYAVRSSDTIGASESLPALLNLKGIIEMGKSSDIAINSEEAMGISTGGMLPENADAVVMMENTDSFDDGSILINESVASGENVIWEGEDIKSKELVLKKDHVIREQDIGALSALGILEIFVYKKPTVGIISTGDELVSPEEELTPGKIRDINSWAIKACVEKAQAIPKFYGIIQDEQDEFYETLTRSQIECDLVIISGGSSVGTRDLAAKTINDLGEPGVIFHGVSVKPGKPTIFGLAQDTPIFGLSGNPVSALVTFDLFVRPAIRRLLGLKPYDESEQVSARITRNLSSKGGREDYIRVSLTRKNDGTLEAEPILGESGLIFTLVEADGIIRIPQNTEGITAGESVQVFKRGVIK
ncbi:gephyrin-like molybdotransferase Glp [Natranaerobius trueperi]|uniref:Molybdopterin molybdenumtransferase n=1 Tax=Natranaerobius trueperi TaxID=759412 RepID=A0A226C2B7_9FIRM|nr:gephyrin-like molybdotransferase Glp [Natranaerobius trueperi]OWZ84754.1 molybdopterin molybdenumtransferase MoeA [Natranaerobius trueperi]